MWSRAALAAGVLAAATVAPEPGPSPSVELPAGSFQAGERRGPLDDTLAYSRVSRFLLDATEVTVAQYAACVRAGRCTPVATTVSREGLGKADRDKWSAFCNADRADRANHPVNCVDWKQAEAYCAFAGKRLPTEDEWEWAARGGPGGTPYPWGKEPPGDRACWSGAGERAGTCPVGTHAGGDSPASVHDLAGNVWEWTATGDVVGTDSRGRGGTAARIARGGGWADRDPKSLAAARRAKNLPQDRAADLGFRCAGTR